MNIEHATIALVPRSTGNCLDLAVMFFGRHLRPILSIWACVAIPSVVLVYFCCRLLGADLRMAVFVILFATSPLGILLIHGVGPCTFGDAFSLRTILFHDPWRKLAQIITGLSLRGLIAVGPILICTGTIWWGWGVILIFVPGIFPGLFLLFRRSFMAENASLASLNKVSDMKRMRRLFSQQAWDLFFRSFALSIMTSVFVVIVFLTVDMALGFLFGYPLVVQRLMQQGSGFDLLYYFVHDPILMSALTATTLLVYPIGRLAWFFCYVDVRVRFDMWDLELRMHQEARKILGDVTDTA